MSTRLILRYRNGAGPVQMYSNGFLVVNDRVGESGNVRLEPYVLPGRNLIRLDARAAPQATVSLQAVQVPDDGGSGEVILLELHYPDPRAPSSVLDLPLDVPSSFPRWLWSQIQPAPPGAEQTLPSFLAAFAQLVLQGPDDELVRQLSYKHTEVGNALGIGKDRMDEGLISGLRRMRASPTFQVIAAASADLMPAWSPDRRFVRPMHRSGEDAIQYRGDGNRWFPFELCLGFHRDNWIVIR